MAIKEIRVELPNGKVMVGAESTYVAKPLIRRTFETENGMTGSACEPVEDGEVKTA